MFHLRGRHQNECSWFESVGVSETLTARTTQEGNPSTKKARAAAGGGSYGLEHCVSEMNQAQLDGLWVLLHILTTISMRVPAHDDLFHDAIEDNNVILFSMEAL